MKILRAVLFSLALMLMLTACGKEDFLTNCPTAPTETTGNEMCALVQAPTMKIQYQDEQFLCSATLTPAVHTYALGAEFPVGTRPCEQDALCTVTLADTEGEVRLAFFPEVMNTIEGTEIPNAIEGADFYAAEALTDLALTAYPVAEDGTVAPTSEVSQIIPVTNARFTLLVGTYYYELTVPQNGGHLTYGFIAHRIDAEEYKVTEHVSGCCVEIEYEDPDHLIKQLPQLHIKTPFGREQGSAIGMLLDICGRVVHTYVNHAGTGITRSADLGDPLTVKDSHNITTSRLDMDYMIEWPWSHKGTAAQYQRYTHDGTLVDGKALIAADIQGTNIVHLEPNFYYVFTVYYEDLSVQYVLKTGKGVDEITPHPKDDPSIDRALAKYLRAEHMHYYHLETQTLDKADVYIYRYLGQYDGMEAVMFEEVNTDCQCMRGENTITLGGQTITLPGGRQLYFYHTHRFYSPEEAYQNGWITDADVTAIAARLNEQ